MYLKDLSLEQPNSPAIFLEQEAPSIEVSVDVGAEPLAEGIYESTVTVTVTAKIKDKIAFLVEGKQAGIFEARNIPEEQLGPLLGIGCPNIVYPYLRSNIADAITRAGFPPIHLSEINFEVFYQQRLQAITEQQRSSTDYSVEKTVYTIVVMTAPYRINERTREFYKDEVLISKLNPKNLKGDEFKIFNHELVYLNPNYKTDNTPQNYRDWLDLIYESIHSPAAPKINFNNEGVKRASEIINYDNISPEDWEQSKIEVGKQKVILLEREAERFVIAKKMMNLEIDDEKISKATGLSISQVQWLRENKENIED